MILNMRPVPEIADLLVPLLALHQLLVTLRTAQVFHHRGVAEELLQEREITRPPRFDANGARLGHDANVRSTS